MESGHWDAGSGHQDCCGDVKAKVVRVTTYNTCTTSRGPNDVASCTRTETYTQSTTYTPNPPLLKLLRVIPGYPQGAISDIPQKRKKKKSVHVEQTVALHPHPPDELDAPRTWRELDATRTWRALATTWTWRALDTTWKLARFRIRMTPRPRYIRVSSS